MNFSGSIMTLLELARKVVEDRLIEDQKLDYRATVEWLPAIKTDRHEFVMPCKCNQKDFKDFDSFDLMEVRLSTIRFVTHRFNIGPGRDAFIMVGKCVMCQTVFLAEKN
jgi:hypothetical protein